MVGLSSGYHGESDGDMLAAGAAGRQALHPHCVVWREERGKLGVRGCGKVS